MSAKKLHLKWFEMQAIAEQDETYITNARLAVQSWKAGEITPVQLSSLIEWQQKAAVRRHNEMRGVR